MKTDKQLFNELQERHKTVRLFTEAQILDLMGKARREVIEDRQKRVPDMKALQEEFNAKLERSKNDPSMAPMYNRLTDDKKAWVWFAEGAASVLKRFRDAN